MDSDTLFHRGEIALQLKDGSREQVAAFAQRAIRSFMPEQHREFFQTLPFMVAGVVDSGGRPWATLLSGRPGFVQSPTETLLTLDVAAPSAPRLAEGLEDGAAIGLLGIELPTRRRNRANGTILRHDTEGLIFQVQESFGNCPKYIQTRQLEWLRSPMLPVFEALAELDAEALALIKMADTFFVASYAEENGRRVDVSHRGGLTGFVQVLKDKTLLVPDFIGNHLFNTLGNFVCNPVAGLVFPDFTTGDLLHLTGKVELDWEGASIAGYAGALRGWTFRFNEGFWLRSALPFRGSREQYSPFLTGMGPWQAD